MAIKLIATDLDGTFYHRDRTYDKARFDRLLALMNAQDIKFVVASGNQYCQLISFFDHPDEMSFVAENGALIVHEGKELFASVIDRNIWLSVVETIQTIDEIEFVLVNGVKSAYCPITTKQEDIEFYSHYFPKMQVVDDFTSIDDRIIKLSLVTKEAAMDTIAEQLKHIVGNQLRVVTSGHGDIDLLANGINKAHALAQLMQIWNIKPDEVMAFGDAMNDYEMLKMAKYGFVMKNGNQKLKDDIGRVVPFTNEEDGELIILDEYFNDPQLFLKKYA